MNIPDPHISDAECTDFDGRLEDRYKQGDMIAAHPPFWARVDSIGRVRWTSSYVVKRQSGMTHEDATRAVLEEIDVIVGTPPPPIIQPGEHLPTPELHGRLRVVGNQFHDDAGPWRWRMVTAFDAFHLFCQQTPASIRQLERYAEWTRAVGANGWRVFGMWVVTGFDYRWVRDYFVKLDNFCDYVASKGLRLEFVALADCQRFAAPIVEAVQLVVVDAAAAVLARHENACLEVANEPWNNGVNPLAFDLKRDGLLIARGADKDGAIYAPSLGYTTVHQKRTVDWYRYVGKDLGIDAQGITKDVVVADEPMKSSINNDPVLWARAGANAAMFCGGITAHGESDTLQRCVVPAPPEEALVRTMLDAAALVPADAPTWRYARYGPAAPNVPMPVERDQDDDATIRLYAKVGDTHACALSLHHGWEDGWRPKGANGWKVVRQTGSFVLCERA